MAKLDYFGTTAADTIDQSTTNFDSSSVVSAYGDGGNDAIYLNGSNHGASIFASGGSDRDLINITNTGSTTIYGGNSASDPSDGADTIAFAGGGNLNLFSNAGSDSVTVVTDSTGVANVFAGVGDDLVSASGDRASIFVGGGEGTDSITVHNTGGATTIYGGISSSDSTDASDVIHVAGSGNSGTWNVFGNAGDDLIDATASGAYNGEATVSIYGGIGQDTITIGSANVSGADRGSSVFVAGGEGSDVISVHSSGSTTIYGGANSADTTDAADTIQVYGSGKSDVFGNGGNDSIVIGVNLQDSATSVTVNGGVGNDTISVISQGGGGSDTGHITLSGGAGADTFVVPASALSSIAIKDFNPLEGDHIQFTGGPLEPVLGVVGNFGSLDAALNAAANVTTNGGIGGLLGNVLGVTAVLNVANGTVQAVAGASVGTPAPGQITGVVQGGDGYLIVNDGVAGFNPLADHVIKLTGVTDLNSLLAHTGAA